MHITMPRTWQSDMTCDVEGLVRAGALKSQVLKIKQPHSPTGGGTNRDPKKAQFTNPASLFAFARRRKAKVDSLSSIRTKFFGSRQRKNTGEQFGKSQEMGGKNNFTMSLGLWKLNERMTSKLSTFFGWRNIQKP